MTRGKWLIVTLLIQVLAIASARSASVGKEYVDLELVLAVDVSLSMDNDEKRLQRGGYVAAFRDPSLVRALKSGPNGRVAVTYVEWAGAGIQSVIIPWRIIASSEDARSFADELAAKPITRALMTSISEVLLMSRRLFSTSPVQGLRRVIDVSGDGPNNSGSAVEAARDRVVAAGIMINGLAIRIRRGLGAYSYFDLPDLDRYYRDCVIGGGGAFVLSIQHAREFATAIRQKLLLEIANAAPQRMPRLRRVELQRVADKYDCLIGEKLWRDYQQDQW